METPDILQIKTEVPWLDVEPEQPDQQVVREFLQIRYGDLDEVRSLLQTLVPDVTLNTDSGQSTLIIEGTPAAVEQAKELLDQLDRPLDQIVMECKLLRVTEAWQGIPLRSSASVRVGTFSAINQL